MNENFSFEQALKRLEEIVETLEAGNISLEESIKIYQEGIALSKLCSGKLEEAEGKVMA
ncbi:MAG TPA: exodeoxyribonuclease VII small subunit, partial [Clostridia bacterium]|nr:exodeoxyribonuclease VII small subunit [Clostridia bacterium]